MTSHVVFSIDDPTPERVHSFHKMLSRKGPVRRTVGLWEGVEEPGFLVTAELFQWFVRHSGWVDRQEAILFVNQHGDADILYLRSEDKLIDRVGFLQNVHKDVALAQPGYTYLPDTNSYWVASEEDLGGTVMGFPDYHPEAAEAA